MQNATEDLINYKLRQAREIMEGIDQDMKIMHGIVEQARELIEEQKSGN